MSPRQPGKCDRARHRCRPARSRRATRRVSHVARGAHVGRHDSLDMSPRVPVPCGIRRRECRPARPRGATASSVAVAPPGRATVVTVHVAPPARAERHARRAWSLQSTERGDRRRLPCRPAGSGGASWNGESVARVDQAGRHVWRASPWRAFDAVSTSCAVGGRGRVGGLTERGTKGRCVGPQARSSVVEHYLDTVGVGGSKPLAPTRKTSG